MQAVKIVEVGPRDGLQNEPHFVATETKIALINLLSETGLKTIEVTSFVSPKSIPQLADHASVFQGIQKEQDITYSVLIPNEQGMLAAIKAGVSSIAIFTAASETFNQRNIHCSIKESLNRFSSVVDLAKKNRMSIRAYISCAIGCPYEGNISSKEVVKVAEALLNLGAKEISFGDTIGVATPKQIKTLIQSLKRMMPLEQIAMHFHDTYGQAIANIYASLEENVFIFDSSVAGLGGCPYARGATGNVATEDVLYLLHGLGLESGVDIYKVVNAGDMICKALNRRNQSKVANALLANPY